MIVVLSMAQSADLVFQKVLTFWLHTFDVSLVKFLTHKNIYFSLSVSPFM